MHLAGKVAIVIGAGRGIGKAIALELGRSGCQMSVAARSVDQLVSVADEVQKQGQQAIAVATDIRDESAITVLVERTRAVFGRIDILVNAASLLDRSPFTATPLAVWRDLVATNLSGPYLCMRAVVPFMREQGSGKIINVAGRSALRPDGNASAYAAVKAGLVGMTRSLAIELAASKIQVNVICPADEGVDSDDVAAAAMFLARADAVSGESLEIG